MKADFNYSDTLIPCVVRNDLGPASVAQTAAVEQYYAQYAFQDGVKVNANGLDVREIGGSKYGAIVVGEVRNGDGSTTLTNITQPTHFLYNGSGERTITTSNDRAIITSVGTGSNSSGIIAAANQILGPIIFNEVDRTLRNRIHGP